MLHLSNFETDLKIKNISYQLKLTSQLQNTFFFLPRFGESYVTWLRRRIAIALQYGSASLRADSFFLKLGIFEVFVQFAVFFGNEVWID